MRAATDRRPSKISRLKIELSVLADFKQTEKQVHVRCNRNHQSVPGQTQIQISKETFFILVLNMCVIFFGEKTISIDVKNLKIGHWWYDNLYIFVVILDAILDFHMKY